MFSDWPQCPWSTERTSWPSVGTKPCLYKPGFAVSFSRGGLKFVICFGAVLDTSFAGIHVYIPGFQGQATSNKIFQFFPFCNSSWSVLNAACLRCNAAFAILYCAEAAVPEYLASNQAQPLLIWWRRDLGLGASKNKRALIGSFKGKIPSRRGSSPTRGMACHNPRVAAWRATRRKRHVDSTVISSHDSALHT